MLQAELSVLKHNQPRIHELSSYLMLSDVDEIARVTKSHLGSKATDDQARLDLMHRLQVNVSSCQQNFITVFHNKDNTLAITKIALESLLNFFFGQRGKMTILQHDYSKKLILRLLLKFMFSKKATKLQNLHRRFDTY